jgi:ATP-dependent helicase/nuclease subunit B
LRDPYAIYARHVLRLKPLDPLDAEIGPMDRGSAMHEILEHFIRESSDGFPPNPVARLIGISEEIFARYGVPQATLAVWRPRFARAASWFVADERRRQPEILRSFLEIKGRLKIEAPAGDFILTGRADRIDELRAGGAAIIDYKTGMPPSNSQVGLFASQLPLEGAILERRGFEGVDTLSPAQLVYIRYSGGEQPGETRIVKGDAQQLVAETYANLVRLIAEFDREETAYVSRVAPFRADAAGDYDHLARVREWSLSGWDGA